jgi:hypothetical protein
VGYLLFPLHRKARLGGLFCLKQTDSHVSATLQRGALVIAGPPCRPDVTQKTR